ncbi:MAG TPA: aldo/keto reductase [bacterium]|nr:aldo/keto reductase [bacterium]HMW33767.1 aldo/keto reductase [bacterium]HMW36534.1 aldo/keto reductase [bacterium]HMY34721.1 aldo/keto reductase [bacterium]HMZ05465.1 aldo/keto reductase [bacterium]
MNNMSLNIHSTLRLYNDVNIPCLGLGVWRTGPGDETRKAVDFALRSGYRHIDTAHFYKNEKDVGVALKQSGLDRKNVFITTKLWNDDHGYDRALRAFHESLSLLNLTYVDLYLIHYPVSGKRSESWKALEKLYEEGLCRAIGVSNYTQRHLDELLQSARIKPMVNQVEFHPWLYQNELLNFCKTNGIVLEAYSPLTKGQKINAPELSKIAAVYQRSPVQILIRWALQHGIVVLPKSAQPARITENASVFDFNITDQDMARLDAFNCNLRVAWDPTNTP